MADGQGKCGGGRAWRGWRAAHASVGGKAKLVLKTWYNELYPEGNVRRAADFHMKSNGLKRPSRKQVKFDAGLLLRSLRGHADHLEGKKKLTMRVSKVMVPPRVRGIKPRVIAGIRQKLNVSQPVFAALLNVPLATARSWEQANVNPPVPASHLVTCARTQRVLIGAEGPGAGVAAFATNLQSPRSGARGFY